MNKDAFRAKEIFDSHGINKLRAKQLLSDIAGMLAKGTAYDIPFDEAILTVGNIGDTDDEKAAVKEFVDTQKDTYADMTIFVKKLKSMPGDKGVEVAMGMVGVLKLLNKLGETMEANRSTGMSIGADGKLKV